MPSEEKVGDRYVVFLPGTSMVVGYEVTSPGGARSKLWSYIISTSYYRSVVKQVRRQSGTEKVASSRLFAILSPVEPR
jgi:hypothetical protein